MNIYVIRRATQGLCNYLKSASLPQSVAIGYDSRIKSDLFATEAARVIAANGITAWLYPRLEPTPALSWAVRYLGCGAGICVTASHNPAKYNGYKVYGADGEDYRLISGNEMGVLLLDYICRKRVALGTMPEKPVAVTTIVSTDMAFSVMTLRALPLKVPTA